MPAQKANQKCFIIMPITTPEKLLIEYKGDPDHFLHVLEHLFIPALKNAGFDPIPPKSIGSDIIQAEIIKHLASSELVLCDMSILNPNVFFEFGIRTALNKSVALVVDDKTEKVPFDTSIINFHKYKSSLDIWSLINEINALTKHIEAAYTKTKDYNALWKYFGVAQTGVFKPEESSLGEKIDLLMKEVSSLKTRREEESASRLHRAEYLSGMQSYEQATEYMVRREKEEREKEKKELVQKLKELDQKQTEIMRSMDILKDIPETDERKKPR